MKRYVKKNRYILKLCFAIVSVSIVILYTAIAVLLHILPSVSDANDRIMAILHTHHGIYVAIPSDAKISEAIVSVEDRRFYQHHGLDTFGFIKTALLDLFTPYPNGGATIDEQLAKNLFIQNDSSWQAKFAVAGFALKLDLTYSKKQIIDMYLNEIYYGHQEYGIEQASKGYFGKGPTDLDWAQASLLAGLPQALSYYNPIKDLSAGKFRQELVLKALVRDKYISQSQSQEIYDEQLALTGN